MAEEEPPKEGQSPCVVPEAALRWLILHATTSNVDLGRLSNVNRSWRDVVTSVILEQATFKAAPSGPMLLLPSMAAELIRKNAEDKNSSSTMDGSGSSGAAGGAGANTAEDAQSTSNNKSPHQEETFCAAWFGPEGVQLLDLDAEQQPSDEEESSDDDYANGQSKSKQGMHRNCRKPSSAASNAQKKKKNAHPTARSKSPMMMMNIQRRAPRLEQIPQVQVWGRGHGPTAKVSFEDQGILVTHEWRGYRHAMQILFPFGYAEFFVQHVLQRAQMQDQMRRMDSDQQQQQAMDVSDRVEDVNRRTSNHLEDEYEPVTDATQTTIAVRGATIARPEGYCLCWDKVSAAKAEEVSWQRSSTSKKKKNENNNNDEMVQTIKLQEKQRKLKQWKEWRKQLQLTVLPQVLVRRPPTSNAVVQFLNSDEKHAVRFLTPKFQCGPIGEPVTIFVVGIATEDGCFCSGLHHKFELGHLYPNNPLAELAEMSPVCMATDAWECSPSEAGRKQSSGPQRTPLEQHLDSDDDSEDDSDEDDYNSNDDSSSDLAGDNSHRMPPHKKRGWLDNCACIFQDNSDPMGFGTSNNPSNSEEKKDNSDANNSSKMTEREDSQTLRSEDDDDDSADGGGDDHADDADRIMRGSRIPGMWHCYTAVFNGKHSVLRVDGVPEVLTASKNANKRANGSSPNTKGEPSPRSRRRGPRAMLDGLTIGSDHCFDMTLCFGQGSGGEGEGAIAEIAVFGGCLNAADLEVIEKELMIKHGIPIPEMTRDDLVQEDEFTRKAHALYCQIPPEAAAAHLSFDQRTIPLRVMTKHRSVAWHQVNAVTGEELRIKRIGSRSAGSSSDW